MIRVLSVYLERGKGGNKGRVICRAVGDQVIYTTPCGLAVYALRHPSRNDIYKLTGSDTGDIYKKKRRMIGFGKGEKQVEGVVALVENSGKVWWNL